MNQSEIKEFTMDPNLLVSVIKSQAGTLSKALLEGVMNSIDAGASTVSLTVHEKGYVIEDNGTGFKSREEIEAWFGRFGTPHAEGDATFGRYRMGRGQLMAFSITKWKSNNFQMDVDIEGNGLTYELTLLSDKVSGCRVEGTLYVALTAEELKDTLTELKKFVAYAPKPVYVNEDLYGAPPARLKSWSFEDDYAYYRVVADTHDLLVYNQGVFVQAVDTWRTGVGGIVVTKKALEVNFARNSILENKCKVWDVVLKNLQKIGVSKLSQSKGLNENERRFLARRLISRTADREGLLFKAKIITDPSGRHFEISTLKNFEKFLYIPDNTAKACAIHGQNKTFVITDKLMHRFGFYSPESLIEAWAEVPDVLAKNFELIQESELGKMGIGGAKDLSQDSVSKKMWVRIETLKWLNQELVSRLQTLGVTSSARNLRMGTHKQKSYIAWTDGRTYITANRQFLKRLDDGMDGMLFWLQTLIHEYMHDTDDSESHSHGEVFFTKYHDVSADPALKLATLAQQGVVVYLEKMAKAGLPQSNELKRQLRPSFKHNAS